MELDRLSNQRFNLLARFTNRDAAGEIRHVCPETRRAALNHD